MELWTRQRLRALVDATWNEATESQTVPETAWADRIIDKVAKKAFWNLTWNEDGTGVEWRLNGVLIARTTPRTDVKVDLEVVRAIRRYHPDMEPFGVARQVWNDRKPVSVSQAKQT